MEKEKIIDIEEFRLKKEEKYYLDWMDKKTGKIKKESKNTSGRIEDLVNEIEKDEFSIFKERKIINELYTRGEYFLEED